MQWKHLNELTYNDLKTLNWGQLSQDEFNLLEQYKDNDLALTSNFIAKLNELCDQANVEIDKATGKSLEKPESFQKVGDLLNLVATIYTLACALQELFPILKELYDYCCFILLDFLSKI